MAALDTIIREYVRAELITAPTPATTPTAGDGNNNTNQDESDANAYVNQLRQCLERHGVIRELQGFLRQRLVGLLGEKWPHLTHSPGPAEGRTRNESQVLLPLIKDFLQSRRLLFTLSVFTGEVGLQEEEEQDQGGYFDKMSSSRAESLLESLGLSPDSRLSRRVLSQYAGDETGNLSILECLLIQQQQQFPGSGSFFLSPEEDLNHNLMRGYFGGGDNQGGFKDKDKEIPHLLHPRGGGGGGESGKSTKGQGLNPPEGGGVEERLRAIQADLEKDKETQVQLAIKEFRTKEEARIRQELGQRLELELLSRERELLERSTHLRDTLEAEKVLWTQEKERQQKELAQEMRRIQKASANHTQHPTTTTPTKSTLADPGPDEEGFQPSSSSSRRLGVDPGHDLDREQLCRLQTAVKVQAQEIKALKEQLQRPPPPATAPPTLPPPTTTSTSNDLLKFLSQSKERCMAIEREAQRVTNKLQEVKGRRSSAPSSPRIPSSISHLHPPPTPPDSTLRRLFLNPRAQHLPPGNHNIPTFPTLHHTQPQPLEKRETSPATPTPSKPQPQPPESLTKQTTEPQKSTGTGAGERYKKASNLAAALTGGALSFGKIPSSSEQEFEEEEEEQRSQRSIRSNSTHSHSSHRLQILHLGPQQPTQSHSIHSTHSTGGGGAFRRTSFEDNHHQPHPLEPEEPVKLPRADSSPPAAEKSLSISQTSISGPKSTGGGGGGDSDFWNL